MIASIVNIVIINTIRQSEKLPTDVINKSRLVCANNVSTVFV